MMDFVFIMVLSGGCVLCIGLHFITQEWWIGQEKWAWNRVKSKLTYIMYPRQKSPCFTPYSDTFIDAALNVFRIVDSESDVQINISDINYS